MAKGNPRGEKVMCNLCGNEEEQQKGREAALLLADDLVRLAGRYRSMARGLLKPHTAEMGGTVSLAKSVIRKLVDEWI